MGLQHYYFSRFSVDGRFVFTLQKREGGDYQPVETWTRALRPVIEEHMLGSQLVEQKGDARATVLQEEVQHVRRRLDIQQHRHETGAHRAKESRRIGRGIVEKHQDAVAALQAQRRKAVAPS